MSLLKRSAPAVAFVHCMASRTPFMRSASSSCHKTSQPPGWLRGQKKVKSELSKIAQRLPAFLLEVQSMSAYPAYPASSPGLRAVQVERALAPNLSRRGICPCHPSQGFPGLRSHDNGSPHGRVVFEYGNPGLPFRSKRARLHAGERFAPTRVLWVPVVG